MARMRWSSQLIFIMAAVGSAVGLGNIWRFPYLAGKYGGGAFLLPYIIMLVFVGVPLLIGEFYLGQRFQKGAVQAYGSLGRAWKMVGAFSLFCGALVISYYAAVMAWTWKYTFASFTLPWQNDSQAYFLESVLQLSSGVDVLGGFVWELVLFLAVTWIAIYFCIFKGVKSVGKVIAVTMPLPIILLLILVLRGITLDGSIEGLAYYLTPNFQALLDLEVWTAAASQIFFTLTLGFGVMVAYASFNGRKENFVGHAISTAVINSSISLLSGFAVFGTLGFMATQQGVAVAEVAAAGPILAFVVFPQALALMPWAPVLFSLIFFIALLTLGIDSAFSLVEGVNASLKDKWKKLSNEKLSLIVCVVMFFLGLIYVTKAGLYYLDIVDHFVTNYGIILVGLLQSIALGWFYGVDKVVAFSKTTRGQSLGAWWSVSTKYVIPVVLLFILGWSLHSDLTTPYEGYPGWALAIGWLAVLLPLVLSILYALLSKEETKTVKRKSTQ